jgi:hypothetical protein
MRFGSLTVGESGSFGESKPARVGTDNPSLVTDRDFALLRYAGLARVARQRIADDFVPGGDTFIHQSPELSVGRTEFFEMQWCRTSTADTYGPRGVEEKTLSGRDYLAFDTPAHHQATEAPDGDLPPIAEPGGAHAGIAQVAGVFVRIERRAERNSPLRI